MKEFLTFIFFCIVLPALFDTYKKYQYKFCKQQKGKSSRKCRNWMCKKTDQCEFTPWPCRKSEDIPPEVCRKGFCRKRSDCRFYIDNWQEQNMVINSEADLENILDSNSGAVEDK